MVLQFSGVGTTPVLDEPASPSVPASRPSPVTGYLNRLLVTDTAAVATAVGVGQVVRFGTGDAAYVGDVSTFSYTAVSVLLATAWLVALSLFRTRDARITGTGVEEYRRVAQASGALFGAVAITAFLFNIAVARGYLAVALPLGVLGLLVGRKAWRRWLHRQRLAGQFVTRVLVVGSHDAAVAMAETFERSESAGYDVVGVCVPGWPPVSGRQVDVEGHRIPVLGDHTCVLRALHATGADVVAVSNTEFLGASGMRALAWQLEAEDVDLVVSPGVVDVAGPRLQIHPVAGLPLLHVDKPQYRGASKFGKMLVDFAGAGLALAILSPVMLAIAVLIKLDSRGPVLYRSERIGLNGEPFAMLKFRSMVTDAEQLKLRLLEMNEGAGPLFKMRNDPRVTRVGRWLRRLSLDELPQLLNVVRGEMSIVGPRPPLASEVAEYTGDVHKRLLVKPGITGLWQVSGRSDLSWEESVRLDLFYVENWSMMSDLMIAGRTVGAVCRSRGAY